MRKYIMLYAAMLFLIGCTNQEEGRHANNQENNLQPIHYETPEEQRDRLGQDQSIGEQGGYPQSELEGLNGGETNERNMDRYTNERTMEISEHLSEHKYIKQAQVSETDDRIVVAVILNNHSDQTSLGDVDDRAQQIEREVQQFVQDKQIVVYTDNIYWNRMRNLNSNQISSDENTDRFLEDFFGTDQ
ncbi:YhcN/YlaJ family sporulation lipoprotein [Ornithinibacillus salinisoli]|uniref:YhcN/YlaJ family sporulation lipoprotein n=1 Tax=Ornithinibacillus salinisoli TaxID=1848459 RepID=A0ABW4W3C0_9BACI